MKPLIELRQGATPAPSCPPCEDRGRQIKMRPRATSSEVQGRSRPFLAWSGGQVRFWNGSSLRDLGFMVGQAQAVEWCRVNGVRFLEDLPL
jgi:hypothetical protein